MEDVDSFKCKTNRIERPHTVITLFPADDLKNSGMWDCSSQETYLKTVNVLLLLALSAERTSLFQLTPRLLSTWLLWKK